jgi:hypothetical protein
MQQPSGTSYQMIKAQCLIVATEVEVASVHLKADGSAHHGVLLNMPLLASANDVTAA